MPPTAALEPATSIDEVLERLDRIIGESAREGSRVALFACLYRRVTRAVRDGIAAGRFEDGERMERFDVIFANQYLAALAAYRRGEHPGRSWMAAFEGTRSRRLLILQHLLLGMNAHINHDLGLAAVRTSPGPELPALRDDFFEITRLLGELLDDVQDRISGVSPWLGMIDLVGCRNDEEVFGFCLARARDVAWRTANRLAPLQPDRVAAEMDRVDRGAAVVARSIRSPGLLLLPALACIRSREPDDVARAVAALE